MRIAGNVGSEAWRFWLETEASAPSGSLHIELTVSYWQRSTPALDKCACALLHVQSPHVGNGWSWHLAELTAVNCGTCGLPTRMRNAGGYVVV